MTRFQTRNARVLMLSLALFSVGGCGDSSGPGQSDDPGIELARGEFGPTDIVWTPDGAAVVYALGTAVNVVSVSTHSERQLVSDPSISIRAISGAADRIYFWAVVGTNFRVSRVSLTGGVVENVLTNPSIGLDYLLVSADERFVAAGGGLYDLQRGTRFSLPFGRARGFSPDGSQLLCQVSGGPPDFVLISTADGSSQPLHSTASGSFYFGHRWEGNAPELLDYTLANGTTRIYEVNGVTGAARDIAQVDGTPTFLFRASWSPDGSVLGVWIDRGSGNNFKANLVIIRGGSAPTVAARVGSSFAFGPGSPVFSPSGNSVAYFYNRENDRSLYLKSGI